MTFDISTASTKVFDEFQNVWNERLAALGEKRFGRKGKTFAETFAASEQNKLELNKYIFTPDLLKKPPSLGFRTGLSH